MQQKSLSAEIASKNRKSTLKQEHTLFSQISYSNVRQINYLCDLEQKKKSIDFPIYQFQKELGESAPVNQFGMLADQLYKKIMQHGYIQEKKAPSKKKKKTKNPFQYDYEDAWINDQEAFALKKNVELKFQNFKCLTYGIEQFYTSQQYRSNLTQIQEQAKKKTNDINIVPEELEQIKRKIKQNIFVAHGRMKQEAQQNKNDQKINAQVKAQIENQEADQVTKWQHTKKGMVQQNKPIEQIMNKQEHIGQEQKEDQNKQDILQKQDEKNNEQDTEQNKSKKLEVKQNKSSAKNKSIKKGKKQALKKSKKSQQIAQQKIQQQPVQPSPLYPSTQMTNDKNSQKFQEQVVIQQQGQPHNDEHLRENSQSNTKNKRSVVGTEINVEGQGQEGFLTHETKNNINMNGI